MNEMSDRDSAERRKHERFEIILKVTLQAGETVLTGHSQDISQRGIFIAMVAPLPRGAVVELAIQDDATADPIRMQGKVVHALAGIGNGVEFVSPTQEAEQALARLIRTLKASQA